MARAPTSMMTMAMTQANTGRSRKNLDNIGYLRLLCFSRRLGFFRSIRASLSTGINGDNLYGGAGPHLLNTFDDHLIAGLKSRGDEPLVTDGAVDRDHLLLDLSRPVY